MMEVEGLRPTDLVAAFIQRRVLTQQFRPHLIRDMGGRRDPSRKSTKEMPIDEVAHHVNYISSSQLDVGSWSFGKEPYSRANPPPEVSTRPSSLFSS